VAHASIVEKRKCLKARQASRFCFQVFVCHCLQHQIFSFSIISKYNSRADAGIALPHVVLPLPRPNPLPLAPLPPAARAQMSGALPWWHLQSPCLPAGPAGPAPCLLPACTMLLVLQQQHSPCLLCTGLMPQYLEQQPQLLLLVLSATGFLLPCSRPC
jgi:hypothetical protein